jgi:hypothetical protein
VDPGHPGFAELRLQLYGRVGHLLNYKDSSGSWQEVDLTFHQQGSGYVEDQSDVIVRVTGAAVEATDRSSGEGIRWITSGAPSVSGHTASYTDQGLNWRYATRNGGLKLDAVVSSSLGSRTYKFPYALLGGASALSVDSQGNLVSDAFTVPRPLVIGSDMKSYQTGPWQLLPGNRVAFTFDDSSLPASAYPYVLDPTVAFSLQSRGAARSTEDASGDDGMVTGTDSGYPPMTASGSTADEYVAIQKTNFHTVPVNRYTVGNGLFRWDTSAIPQGANIQDAALVFSTTTGPTGTQFGKVPSGPCIVSNSDQRDLVGEWYDSSNWPIDSGDYTPYASNDAIAGVYLSQFSNTVPKQVQVNLLDGTDGVHTGPNAFTGLRLSISGDQPFGANSLCIASFDSTTEPGPELQISYTIPPKVDSVTYSPNPPYAGDTLDFAVTWEDSIPSSIKVLVCRSKDAPSGGECPGGSWAEEPYSTSLRTSGTDHVQYLTTQLDVGSTHDFWVYACDNLGVCSGMAPVDTPYEGQFSVIDRPPVVMDETHTPEPGSPGVTVQFSVSWADTTGDTERAVICRSGVLNSDGTCAQGEWARGTVSSTANPATAYYTPSSADISTSPNYYWAFVCDSVGLCSAGMEGVLNVVAAQASGQPPPPPSCQHEDAYHVGAQSHVSSNLYDTGALSEVVVRAAGLCKGSNLWNNGSLAWSMLASPAGYLAQVGYGMWRDANGVIFLSNFWEWFDGFIQHNGQSVAYFDRNWFGNTPDGDTFYQYRVQWFTNGDDKIHLLKCPPSTGADTTACYNAQETPFSPTGAYVPNAWSSVDEQFFGEVHWQDTNLLGDGANHTRFDNVQFRDPSGTWHSDTVLEKCLQFGGDPCSTTPPNNWPLRYRFDWGSDGNGQTGGYFRIWDSSNP